MTQHAARAPSPPFSHSLLQRPNSAQVIQYQLGKTLLHLFPAKSGYAPLKVIKVAIGKAIEYSGRQDFRVALTLYVSPHNRADRAFRQHVRTGSRQRPVDPGRRAIPVLTRHQRVILGAQLPAAGAGPTLQGL